MVVKVGELITDALEEIIVQADEAPIEPSEGRAAIRILNDMMTSYALKGVEIGYSVVSSLGDVLTVPAGAIRWMKLQLAVELAPKYDANIKQETVVKLKDAYNAVLNLVIEGIPTEYPSTLPVGSGNSYPDFSNTTFYPDQVDTILTESGGSIALEDDTEEP